MTVSIGISTDDVKKNLKILNSMNRSARLEIGKRFREIAKPAVDEINANKPPKRYPRGFEHAGRTGIGKTKPVRVDVNTRKARASKAAAGATYETLAVIRIRSFDAPTAIAEMAGKVGAVQESGQSRPYNRRPKGHRLNGQGRGLIKGLNKEWGPAARIMWPSAERNASGIEDQIEAVVKDLERAVERELGKIGATGREVRGQMR